MWHQVSRHCAPSNRLGARVPSPWRNQHRSHLCAPQRRPSCPPRQCPPPPPTAPLSGCGRARQCLTPMLPSPLCGALWSCATATASSSTRLWASSCRTTTTRRRRSCLPPPQRARSGRRAAPRSGATSARSRIFEGCKGGVGALRPLLHQCNVRPGPRRHRQLLPALLAPGNLRQHHASEKGYI